MLAIKAKALIEKPCASINVRERCGAEKILSVPFVLDVSFNVFWQETRPIKIHALAFWHETALAPSIAGML